MAEGSTGILTGMNVTWEGGDEDNATLEVQGGEWAFVSCDLRCEKGYAPAGAAGASNTTEREGNNIKHFKDFHLKAKARIWL